MIKNELLTILRECAEESKKDAEKPHIFADLALIEYINDPEITDAYEKVNRWFS